MEFFGAIFVGAVFVKDELLSWLFYLLLLFFLFDFLDVVCEFLSIYS